MAIQDLTGIGGAALTYREVRTRGKFAGLTDQEKVDLQLKLMDSLSNLNVQIEKVRFGYIDSASADAAHLVTLYSAMVGGSEASASTRERSRTRLGNLGLELEPSGGELALITENATHIPGFSVKRKGDFTTIETMALEAVATIDADDVARSVDQPYAILSGDDLILASGLAFRNAGSLSTSTEQNNLSKLGTRDLIIGKLRDALSVEGSNAQKVEAALERFSQTTFGDVSQFDASGTERKMALDKYHSMVDALDEGSKTTGMSGAWKTEYQKTLERLGANIKRDPLSLSKSARAIPTASTGFECYFELMVSFG